MNCAYKVIKETLRYGRWFVTLDALYEEFGKKEIPKAHFVWLSSNPTFKSIPKGYVIHHLDHDQLNDDISNLVLMQKHHHAAHHYKNKVISPELDVDHACFDIDRSVYFPTTEPRIYKRKDTKGGWYFLRFFERDKNGKAISVTCARWDGKRMRTHEQAEEVKAKIWNSDTALSNPNHFLQRIYVASKSK